MPKFSKRSKNNLAQAHPLLQKLFNEVIKHEDCSVICGYRGENEQNDAFKAGNSKLQYPASKHNRKPSLAVDVTPYPIIWDDIKGFERFVGIVKGIAIMMNIDIRLGADFSFKDYPHFEIKEK